MNEFFKNKSLGQISFAVSWTIGAVLFIAFYFSGKWFLIEIGFAFIVLAIIFNFLFLIIELFNAFFDEDRRWIYLKSAGIILLNIPFVIFYIIILLNSP